MKKFFKYLSLLMIFGLVACSGKSISRADAIEMLDAITEKQESDDFEKLNILRLEYSEEGKEIPIEGETEAHKFNIVIAIDIGARQAYGKQETRANEGEAELEESWVYLENDMFYLLSSSNGEKTYTTIAAQEDTEKQFGTEIIFGEIMMVGFALAMYSPNNVKGTLETLDDEDLPVKIKSETYKTKGDGHLSIKISYTAIPGDEVLNGKGELSVVFDNYLLASYKESVDFNQTDGRVINKIDLKMNYKKSGISLPKLDDFTLSA